MRSKQLTPVKPDNKMFDQVEKVIKRVFATEIYLPLLRELKKDTKVTNAKDPKDELLKAIQSGRITFWRGEFQGNLNATLTKALKDIGAKWDPSTQTYKLAKADLPIQVSMSISTAQSSFGRTQQRILDRLNTMVPEDIAGNAALKKIFDASLFKIDKDFKKSIKGITVAPDITQRERDNIAAEYTNNLEKYIQKFTAEEITKLREQVTLSTMSGNRYETLVSDIQRSFNVSANKAKFLARQETKLMMAEFKKTRYLSAGIRQYKWKCVAGSAAHPVRPDHLALKDTIQNYDDPPITNKKTGAKNNPGEDFGCRCFDQPIVMVNK